MRQKIDLIVRNSGRAVMGSLFGGFLMLWIWGGLQVLGEAIELRIPLLASALFVVGWAGGVLGLLYGTASIVLGSDRITVENGTVLLEASIFGRFKTTRNLELKDLRAIEVETVREKYKGGHRKVSKVAFKTADQTIHLRVYTSEAQARQLVEGPLRAILSLR